MWCLEKISVVVLYAMNSNKNSVADPSMNSTGPRPETCGTPKVRGRGGVEVKPCSENLGAVCKIRAEPF